MLLLSKFFSQIKLIQSVVGISCSVRVTGSHFQGPGYEGPMYQGRKSQVARSQFQGPRIPRSRVPGSQDSGSWVPGLRSQAQGLESWVSVPDFRLCQLFEALFL